MKKILNDEKLYQSLRENITFGIHRRTLLVKYGAEYARLLKQVSEEESAHIVKNVNSETGLINYFDRNNNQYYTLTHKFEELVISNGYPDLLEEYTPTQKQGLLQIFQKIEKEPFFYNLLSNKELFKGLCDNIIYNEGFAGRLVDQWGKRKSFLDISKEILRSIPKNEPKTKKYDRIIIYSGRMTTEKKERIEGKYPELKFDFKEPRMNTQERYQGLNPETDLVICEVSKSGHDVSGLIKAICDENGVTIITTTKPGIDGILNLIENNAYTIRYKQK